MVIPALIPFGVRAALPSSAAPPATDVPLDADAEGAADEADGADPADPADSADPAGVVELPEGNGEAATPAGDEVGLAWAAVPDAWNISWYSK